MNLRFVMAHHFSYTASLCASFMTHKFCLPSSMKIAKYGKAKYSILPKNRLIALTFRNLKMPNLS